MNILLFLFVLPTIAQDLVQNDTQNYPSANFTNDLLKLNESDLAASRNLTSVQRKGTIGDFFLNAASVLTGTVSDLSKFVSHVLAPKPQPNVEPQPVEPQDPLLNQQQQQQLQQQQLQQQQQQQQQPQQQYQQQYQPQQLPQFQGGSN